METESRRCRAGELRSRSACRLSSLRARAGGRCDAGDLGGAGADAACAFASVDERAC